MSSYSVVIFGIHLRIRPVAFTLPIGKDGWDIYWYGIIIATGFLLAILYGAKNAGRLNINFDKDNDAFPYAGAQYSKFAKSLIAPEIEKHNRKLSETKRRRI